MRTRGFAAVGVSVLLGLSGAGCLAGPPTSAPPTCSATATGHVDANPALYDVTVAGTSDIADGTQLSGVLTGDAGSGPVVLATESGTFGYRGSFAFTVQFVSAPYPWVAHADVSSGGATLCSAGFDIPAVGIVHAL